MTLDNKLPEKMSFTLTITYEDFIVRDHQLYGVRAVPGVSFIDFIYRFLIMRGCTPSHYEIRSLLFKQPVIPTVDYDQKVVVSFIAQNGYYKFTGKSCPVSDNHPTEIWTDNLEGELWPTEADEMRLIDIPNLMKSADTKIDIDECYRYSRESGLKHYEFMKLLGTASMGADWVLADIRLSDLAEKYIDSFYLHPACLDGSLAVPGASVLNMLNIDYDNTTQPVIPLYITRFRAFDNIKPHSYVYVDKNKIVLSDSEDVMYFNVEIYGEDGKLDAFYERFAAKRVRSEQQIIDMENKVEKIGSGVASTPAEKPVILQNDDTSIKNLLLDAVHEITGRDREEIDFDAEFYDLGMESTDIMSIVSVIEKKLDVELYPTLLFEYTSLSKLCDYLSETYPDRVASLANTPEKEKENVTTVEKSVEATEKKENSEPKALKSIKKLTLEQITKKLIEITAEAIEKDAASIDSNAEFYDLGMESTAVMEIVAVIEEMLMVKLYPTLLFECTNINKLANYIFDNLDSLQAEYVSNNPDVNTKKEDDVLLFPQEVIDQKKSIMDDIVYYPHWVPSDLEVSEEMVKCERILVICTAESEQFAIDICDQLGNDHSVRMVLGDESWRVENGVYYTSLSKRYTIRNALKKIDQIDGVVYLGGVNLVNYWVGEIERYDQSQETGLLGLFRVVKSLIELKMIQNLKVLKALTNHVWKILNREDLNPYSGSISGFMKSLAKEYPTVHIGCIDTDYCKFDKHESNIECAQRVIFELQNAEWIDEVAYRCGNRYLRKVSHVGFESSDVTCLKKNGVYVIAGGTGGLGLMIAEFLVREYDAIICLLSRHEPNAEQQSKIAEIEKMGGTVMHVCADLTKQDEVDLAISMIKGKFGKINGVFHSAFVLKDKTISRMDEQLLLDVMAPKSIGILTLINALQKEPLDFVMINSSAQSFMCALGQANYAAASTCIDAISAAWQESCSYPVYLVNWGYFGEIGAVKSEKYYNDITSHGVGALNTEEGVAFIRQLLSHNAHNLMTVKLDEELRRKAGIDDHSKGKILGNVLPSVLGKITRHAGELFRNYDLTDNGFKYEGWEGFEQISELILLRYFHNAGVMKTQNEKITISNLINQMSIVDTYHMFFRALLDILVRGNYISISGEEITVREKAVSMETLTRLEQIDIEVQKYSDNDPSVRNYYEFLQNCVNSYPKVLTGKASYVTSFYSNGSDKLVKGIYIGNDITDYYNKMVAAMIYNYVEERIKLDDSTVVTIMEVGAGTNATTRFVLEALESKAHNIRFICSDIVVSLTSCNDAEFCNRWPFVEFIDYDIMKSPQKQGVDLHSIDVVFGTNVLHIAHNLENAIANIRLMLKNNGVLIINEATERNDLFTMTFGLSPDWWKYEERNFRIPCAPLLEPRQWENLMNLCKFQKIWRGELAAKEKSRCGQTIIAAENSMFIEDGPYFDMNRFDGSRTIKLKFGNEPLVTEYESLVAYCGIDCRICPSFIYSQNEGSMSEKHVKAFWETNCNTKLRCGDVECNACNNGSKKLIEHCQRCTIRECARSRGYDLCEKCSEYPCAEVKEIMQKFSIIGTKANRL